MRVPFYLLLSASVLFHSCGSGGSAESEASSSDSVNAEHPAADPAHSSQNALDWKGTYAGMLPCDDCDELQVEVTLEDKGRFSRKMTYLGKSKTPLLSAG
ncbi:MAG: copper resistance protein NlpE N-terminal domain-containing protein, partial [Cryomorphaceae bacterium]